MEGNRAFPACTGMYSEVRVLVTLVSWDRILPDRTLIRYWNDDPRLAKNDSDLRRWGSIRVGAEDQIRYGGFLMTLPS